LKETGNNLYQPDENMTGFDFLLLLQRATGISPEDLASYGKEAASFKSQQAIYLDEAHNTFNALSLCNLMETLTRPLRLLLKRVMT